VVVVKAAPQAILLPAGTLGSHDEERQRRAPRDNQDVLAALAITVSGAARTEVLGDATLVLSARLRSE
jgi:hypothetical protein